MSDTGIKRVISHFKYTLQAGIETDMGGFDKSGEDWQTLVGLYLQSQLTELEEMDEETLRRELHFFLSRPTAKIQGLIL